MAAIYITLADNPRIQLTTLECEPFETEHRLKPQAAFPRARVRHQGRLRQVALGERSAGDCGRLSRHHADRLRPNKGPARGIRVRSVILGGCARRGADGNSGNEEERANPAMQ